MKHVFLVKLESGVYISNKGFSASAKDAIEFNSPISAVKAAEKRSGSIDEPISIVRRVKK